MSPTRVVPKSGRSVAMRLTAALALATVVASAASASASASTPAPPLAPTWAVDTPTAGRYGHLDVDRLGRPHVSAEGALYRRFASDGSVDLTVGFTGTGTVEVRGLAVDADLGVTVAGLVEGAVTLDGIAGPVVLDGGASSGGASFLVHLDEAGLVTWSREVPDSPDDINVFELFEASGTVVLSGQFVGDLTIGNRTVSSNDDFGAFASGFDRATGAPRWLTGVVRPADDGGDAEPIFLSGGIDDDSLALVGAVGVDRTIDSAGAATTIDCTPRDPEDPGESCFGLVDLDLATGQPRLARRVGPELDQAWRVAQSPTGYVVTGARVGVVPPPDRLVGTAVSLDGAGDPLWTQSVAGMGPEIPVEVDARGDVIISETVSDSVTIGTDADAVHLNRPGFQYLAMVELGGADGGFVRGTTVGGNGAAVEGLSSGSVAIGPDDQLVVAGRHEGDPIAVGTGPRAIQLIGTSDFVASFPPDLAPAAGSTFHPTTPTRLLDSRTATGGWGSKLVAGTPRTLAVAGVAGVPAAATAVVVNLTTTDVSAMTYLTAWPTGQPRPTASTMNVVAGDTISNHATLAVGEGGSVTIATAQGSTNVVADLLGWYAPDDAGSVYHSADPVRLLDSRTSTGGWGSKLVAGAPRPLVVAGTSDIPADATAVTLSVTVTDTSELTYLRVQPTGSVVTSSNIAVNAGQTITNLVTVPVGPGGSITFTTNRGSVNVVADAVGYYDHDTNNGARFHTVSPRRVLDSRTGNGGYATPWAAGTSRTITLDGAVPSGAAIAGLVTNLTATDTTSMSYLTLYASAPRPGTSNLLVAPGQTIAVAANTGVASDGTVSLFNQLGQANLVLDVSGYFSAPPAP